MDILHLDHYTLRVAPQALPALLTFYADVLGLREGARPDFTFPGHWLYSGERALVHLAGSAPEGEAEPSATLPTGRFNHMALRVTGLKAARERLQRYAVLWSEAPVPGMALHQVFVRDPAGLLLELTFDAAECADAGPLTQTVPA